MDIYPDVAIQAGLLGERSLLASILSALARFALGKASAVIVIGRCMVERASEMGVPADSIHLIPNWVNENHVFPVSHPDNSLRHELGLQGAFVVLYSGNLGVSHSFDDVLEVARRCRGMRDLRFVFVGDGTRRAEVERTQMRDRLDNVILLPYQPSERLAESMSLGDVHFITLRERFEGLVVPSKAYAALAAGRPSIYQGNAAGEVARMIVEEQVGLVVSQGDPDGLERAVLHYYDNPDLVAVQGERALALAKSEYSCRHALERYAGLLLGQG
jgi:glycosyltransferase involved in cell wall biosynthesis